MSNASHLDVRYKTASDCHRNCSKLWPRSSKHKPTSTNEGLSNTFKQIRYAGDVVLDEEIQEIVLWYGHCLLGK
ncbi:hypothetical protein TNCV_1261091 [Trichonephila clavipes]|nr:hypothetical protein TNCV_1261091 [Trichonephila clavipes]